MPYETNANLPYKTSANLPYKIPLHFFGAAGEFFFDLFWRRSRNFFKAYDGRREKNIQELKGHTMGDAKKYLVKSAYGIRRVTRKQIFS